MNRSRPLDLLTESAVNIDATTTSSGNLVETTTRPPLKCHQNTTNDKVTRPVKTTGAVTMATTTDTKSEEKVTVVMRRKQNNLQDVRHNKCLSLHSPFIKDNLSSPTSRTQKTRSTYLPQDIIIKRSPEKKRQPTLLEIINNKKSRSTFREFLESQHSGENLSFWLSCEKFKRIKSEEGRREEANSIYDRYIRDHNAPEQVNLTHYTRREVSMQMTCGDTLELDIFDTAQKYVFNIMDTDCLPRYLQSSYHKQSSKSGGNLLKTAFSNILTRNKNNNNAVSVRRTCDVHKS